MCLYSSAALVHCATVSTHTEILYPLLSGACILHTRFILKLTVGKGSTPVHSRCCGNKYFILESNWILWPWAPYQTIDSIVLIAILPSWRAPVQTHARAHTRKYARTHIHTHTQCTLWTVSFPYICSGQGPLIKIYMSRSSMFACSYVPPFKY